MHNVEYNCAKTFSRNCTSFLKENVNENWNQTSLETSTEVHQAYDNTIQEPSWLQPVQQARISKNKWLKDILTYSGAVLTRYCLLVCLG